MASGNDRGRRSFVLMGVSGCGKSTIGQSLAAATGGTFLDADHFHPPANIEKMSRGIPLDDADRAGWIEALRDAIRDADAALLFVACSALKRKHRSVLREASPTLTFIYLHGSKELLARRIAERSDHFMPPGLLDSQLADLEAPTGATLVDISPAPDEIVASICKKFGL
jgi:carbohydrate kinase (thermoresistant glucokinase family)